MWLVLGYYVNTALFYLQKMIWTVLSLFVIIYDHKSLRTINLVNIFKWLLYRYNRFGSF